jgi:hypothetical protein
MTKGTAFKEILQDSGSFFKDILVYKNLVHTSNSAKKKSTLSKIFCHLTISQVSKIEFENMSLYTAPCLF